jgi:hypothetical protein
MGLFDFLKKQSKENVDQSTKMQDVEMSQDDNLDTSTDTGSDDFSGSDDSDKIFYPFRQSSKKSEE